MGCIIVGEADRGDVDQGKKFWKQKKKKAKKEGKICMYIRRVAPSCCVTTEGKTKAKRLAGP